MSITYVGRYHVVHLLITWARPLVVMAAGRWRARAHDGGSDMEPSMLTTMVAAVAAAVSALAAAMDRSLSREKACCTCGVRWLRPSELGAACLLFLCVPSWLSVSSFVCALLYVCGHAVFVALRVCLLRCCYVPRAELAMLRPGLGFCVSGGELLGARTL